MRDEAIAVDENQPLAHQAVSYLLRRMRVDVNLRWYMVGTEAFARLCRAEAMLTGETEAAIEKRYSTPAEHCKDDVADAPDLRSQLEARAVDEEHEREAARNRRTEDSFMSPADVPAWLKEGF